MIELGVDDRAVAVQTRGAQARVAAHRDGLVAHYAIGVVLRYAGCGADFVGPVRRAHGKLPAKA